MKDFKRSYERETNRIVYPGEKQKELIARLIDKKKGKQEADGKAQDLPGSSEKERENIIYIKGPDQKEYMRHIIAGVAAVLAVVLLTAGGLHALRQYKVPEAPFELPSAVPQEEREEKENVNEQQPAAEEQAQELAWEVMEHKGEVYTPEILYASQEKAVFYDYRALFIYSLTERRLTGAVDLQEHNLNYFDDPDSRIATRLLMDQEGKKLLCYNVDGEEGSTSVGFLFDLEDFRGKLTKLEPEKISEGDIIQFPALNLSGGECRYEDTFSLFPDFCNSLEDTGKYTGNGQYSRRTFFYTVPEDTEMAVTLYNQGQSQEGLTIRVYDINTGKEEKYRVFQGIEKGDREEKSLPPYRHQSEDPDEMLLYSAIAQEEEREDGSVIIPMPVLVDRFEEDGYLKLFVVDGYEYLAPYGDTLLDQGGGRVPSVYYFKRNGNSFQYVKKTGAMDGSYYESSVREFCKGHKKTAEKLLSIDVEKNQEVLLANLASYVKENGLAYRYWKQYGWGKIEIPVDK